MDFLELHFRAFLSSYPSEIFVYAIKHDHPKLMNETAQYLARSPFTSILKQLPPTFMVPWVTVSFLYKGYRILLILSEFQSLYRDAWTAVFKDAGKHITQIPPSSLHYCHLNPSSPWQSSLSDSDTSRICGTCRSLLYTWVATWEEIDTVSALNDTLQAACDKGIRMPGCCAAIERGHNGAAKPDFKCVQVIKLAKLCHSRILEIPSFDTFLGKPS